MTKKAVRIQRVRMIWWVDESTDTSVRDYLDGALKVPRLLYQKGLGRKAAEKAASDAVQQLERMGVGAETAFQALFMTGDFVPAHSLAEAELVFASHAATCEHHFRAGKAVIQARKKGTQDVVQLIGNGKGRVASCAAEPYVFGAMLYALIGDQLELKQKAAA